MMHLKKGEREREREREIDRQTDRQTVTERESFLEQGQVCLWLCQDPVHE